MATDLLEHQRPCLRDLAGLACALKTLSDRPGFTAHTCSPQRASAARGGLVGAEVVGGGDRAEAEDSLPASHPENGLRWRRRADDPKLFVSCTQQGGSTLGTVEMSERQKAGAQRGGRCDLKWVTGGG